MADFLSLKPKAFGLDIHDQSIKLVQLKKSGRNFKLLSFNEVKIEPGIIDEGVIKNEDELVKIIKKACHSVRGKRLNTKYVVASLPEAKGFLQVIQMPKMAEEELRMAVPYEVENYIPLSADDVYLDFQVVPPLFEKQNTLDVLIVALPKKIVDSYVCCLKKSGLVPYVLEIDSQAIARVLLNDGEECHSLVVLDFGEGSTDFIVFSNDSVRFTASIPIVFSQLIDALSKKMDIDYSKAEKLITKYNIFQDKGEQSKEILSAVTPLINSLIEQVEKYLNFYQEHAFDHNFSVTDKQIEKIIISGGGAMLKGLPEFLSKKLKIPVHFGDLRDSLFSLKGKRARTFFGSDRNYSSFTVALGLAVRGADNKE